MVGIENAGRKYDSVEVYLAKNEIGKHDIDMTLAQWHRANHISEEYTAALIQEVTQHLMDEVPQYSDMDENNTAAHFIKAKVKKTVQDKLAALQQNWTEI